MRCTTAAALLLAAPLLLHPATDDATAPTLRGFDPASQAQEIKWEQQARALPDAARIGEFIRRFSSQAHLAGTPQSKQTAEGILAQLREARLDASIERFEALLPTPKSRTLEITAPVKLRLKLDEPPIPGDPGSSTAGMAPPYNAYSADGNITAPLVYANYGLPEDYDLLATRGVAVKGRIVLVRYGRSFRGTKPKVAYEHGAIGCIIYSDPRDDGFFQGDAYPKGPWRPAEGVQRGSILDLPLYPGDPLSPGWASEAGSKRLSISEAQTIMKIPMLPISWADAQPLLANMTGPVAPESWRGAIPVTYHLGPLGTDARSTTVHMAVAMDNATRPLYDVIARIPGSEFPDQWILDGNHHDAWVHGASDPLSGAGPLMETARALAALARGGWKPKRTILFAFWDGEEFGLAGSTEWMEKHADELDRKLVAYMNADSSGQGRLNIGGSHSLEAFAQEITRDVNDPVTGKPLEAALETNREFRIAALGSGSDYTPFLQHLGIATLDVRFASEDGGVYHSDYDDFNWFSRFGDPGFVHGRALSQLHLTALMRFADAPLLPFEFGRLAATLRRYTDEIERLPSQTPKPDFKALRDEIARLQKTAGDLSAAWSRALPSLAGASAEKLAAINQSLFRTERAFIIEPGLPGRPWYRHRIYAPGVYTGYAAKTMPGIREAVEAGKPDEARAQAAEVLQTVRTLTDEVAEAARLIAQL
ncbi:MAG TPA: transferrin receptor-like dimerization domain-containing protein [Bryobacteraceae bacterium]|jgi:N-acetylated-alpha-linked acidic dipeptidase|nr:transferrin receptor-like dimerization domain-containing protein [Bryobacteraceae bacterium]